ncbi:DUF4293 domain-containing protein [Aureispira]|nr:DUF4293 domain-containing protein [Aureispira sp.]
MGQIQRIQTLYLLLVSFLGGSLFTIPFAIAPQEQEGIFLDGLLNIHDHSGLMVMCVLIIVLSLVATFLYNNRVLQINLSKVNMLISSVLFIFAAYLYYAVKDNALISGGILVPVIVVVLLFFANKNILKDEKLVRDSNRLR